MDSLDLRKTIRWTILLTLSLNFVFLIKDLSDDYAEGAGFWHIGPEVVLVLGTVLTAVLALALNLRLKDRADRFEVRVAELEVSNRDWQTRTKSFSQGLALEIERQFDRWGLSPAEKEIALLLLKGLSHREIAEIRSTAEHTIKQQSSAVYRKSGLRTRAELSAFFLEDLLSPGTPPPAIEQPLS